ncbi:MAG: hypothetical protein ACQESR_29435 [Planctomycetota bacterium]
MERCPSQAVLPLVGLAAEKVIRDRCNSRHEWDRKAPHQWSSFRHPTSLPSLKEG